MNIEHRIQENIAQIALTIGKLLNPARVEDMELTYFIIDQAVEYEKQARKLPMEEFVQRAIEKRYGQIAG